MIQSYQVKGDIPMKRLKIVLISILLCFGMIISEKVKAWENLTIVNLYMIVNNSSAPNISGATPVSEGRVVFAYAKVYPDSKSSIKEPYFTTNLGNIYASRLNSYKLLTPVVYKTVPSNVPIWSQPRSTSTKIRTISTTGSKTVIVGSTVNSHGNTWYKTSDGYWVFSGNITKNQYQINTSDVRYFEKPVSTTKVFREQLIFGQGAGTCTLASYSNLMRRYEIIYKNSTTLLNKDENYFGQFAWGSAGLKGTIYFTPFSPTVVVSPVSDTVSFINKDNNHVQVWKKKIIDWLRVRPEGIIAYSRDPKTNAVHAILITDYDSVTDTFFMYDPGPVADITVRTKLVNAKIYGVTQNEKIKSFFKYWMVKK